MEWCKSVCPKKRRERCLIAVRRYDQDLSVPQIRIQDTEDLRIFQAGDTLVHSEDRVHVTDIYGIKATVVYAKLLRIFLLRRNHYLC